MKKILITGGAGFVGYHLAKKLLSCDYEIDILDNFSRGVSDEEFEMLTKNNNINLLSVNLLNPNVAKELHHEYSYIYHFAALIGVQHVLKSPYHVLDKNVALLKNILEIANKQKKLKRFVFASTSEVYAGTLNYHGLGFPTEESTPLTINNVKENRTSYMLSKIYGEAMCLHSGLPVTIVRPHNFYGPRMGLSHVIPELMKKIIEVEQGAIDVFSVKHKRTFCYITDGIEMIKLLAESEKSIGNYYNIGSEDEEISMGKLAEKIIKLISKNIKINSLPPTPGSPERRCPSIKKLKDIVPYSKKFSLDKGLNETFNWYNENIFSGKEISAI
jgi:UDP-glucose 4-epimerase